MYLKSNFTFITENLIDLVNIDISFPYYENDYDSNSDILYLKYSQKYLNFSQVAIRKINNLEILTAHLEKFPTKFIKTIDIYFNEFQIEDEFIHLIEFINLRRV